MTNDKRTEFIFYSDGMTKDEKDARIAEYRAEGWKSISVTETKSLASGSGFKTAYVISLGRFEPKEQES